MDVKQTLANWALIELQNDNGNTAELLVWGEPTNRPSNHFKLTSPVSKIEDEVTGESCLVHTMNSIYRVVGNSQHYKFPLAAYEMLAQGHAPADVTRFFKPIPKEPQYHESGPLKGKRIIGPLFDGKNYE